LQLGIAENALLSVARSIGVWREVEFTVHDDYLHEHPELVPVGVNPYFPHNLNDKADFQTSRERRRDRSED
jgi:hypothetical protein